jgi:hypothetical protein
MNHYSDTNALPEMSRVRSIDKGVLTAMRHRAVQKTRWSRQLFKVTFVGTNHPAIWVARHPEAMSITRE